MPRNGPDTQGTLRMTADGLELPDDVPSIDDGMVFRTPSMTINHRSGCLESLFGSKFPLLEPRHWDVDSDSDAIANEDCVPNIVGIKPYGEDQRWYEVEFETERTPKPLQERAEPEVG